jgi:hypothetical protein
LYAIGPYFGSLTRHFSLSQLLRVSIDMPPKKVKSRFIDDSAGDGPDSEKAVHSRAVAYAFADLSWQFVLDQAAKYDKTMGRENAGDDDDDDDDLTRPMPGAKKKRASKKKAGSDDDDAEVETEEDRAAITDKIIMDPNGKKYKGTPETAIMDVKRAKAAAAMAALSTKPSALAAKLSTVAAATSGKRKSTESTDDGGDLGDLVGAAPSKKKKGVIDLDGDEKDGDVSSKKAEFKSASSVQPSAAQVRATAAAATTKGAVPQKDAFSNLTAKPATVVPTEPRAANPNRMPIGAAAAAAPSSSSSSSSSGLTSLLTVPTTNGATIASIVAAAAPRPPVAHGAEPRHMYEVVRGLHVLRAPYSAGYIHIDDETYKMYKHKGWLVEPAGTTPAAVSGKAFHPRENCHKIHKLGERCHDDGSCGRWFVGLDTSNPTLVAPNSPAKPSRPIPLVSIAAIPISASPAKPVRTEKEIEEAKAEALSKRVKKESLAKMAADQKITEDAEEKAREEKAKKNKEDVKARAEHDAEREKVRQAKVVTDQKAAEELALKEQREEFERKERIHKKEEEIRAVREQAAKEAAEKKEAEEHAVLAAAKEKKRAEKKAAREAIEAKAAADIKADEAKAAEESEKKVIAAALKFADDTTDVKKSETIAKNEEDKRLAEIDATMLNTAFEAKLNDKDLCLHRLRRFHEKLNTNWREEVAKKISHGFGIQTLENCEKLVAVLNEAKAKAGAASDVPTAGDRLGHFLKQVGDKVAPFDQPLAVCQVVAAMAYCICNPVNQVITDSFKGDSMYGPRWAAVTGAMIGTFVAELCRQADLKIGKGASAGMAWITTMLGQPSKTSDGVLIPSTGAHQFMALYGANATALRIPSLEASAVDWCGAKAKNWAMGLLVQMCVVNSALVNRIVADFKKHDEPQSDEVDFEP